MHHLIDSREYELRFDRLIRRRQVEKPAQIRSENPLLVDCLIRSGVAKLRRTICRQENEWNAILRSFNDSGVPVRHRGARSGDPYRWSTGCSCMSERMKGSTTLVIMHHDLRATIGSDGRHQRRGARAGCDAELGDVLSDQLLDDQVRPESINIWGVRGQDPARS